MGIAYALEKNSAGVAILKQEPDGTFKILRTKQTSSSGTVGTYQNITCD